MSGPIDRPLVAAAKEAWRSSGANVDAATTLLAGEIENNPELRRHVAGIAIEVVAGAAFESAFGAPMGEA